MAYSTWLSPLTAVKNTYLRLIAADLLECLSLVGRQHGGSAKEQTSMDSISQSGSVVSEAPSCAGSEQEVTSPARRPRRKSSEKASANWQVKQQTAAQLAANGKRTGRPSNIAELQSRKKQGSLRSTAQAWNLGDSTSESSKQEKTKYNLLNHYHRVVKPLSDAVKELTKADRDQIRLDLDAFEARKHSKKRKHKPACEVSRETIKRRLSRFEEDCGNDIVGHLRAWIEQDKENRLDSLLELLKGFGDALFNAHLSALDGLSGVEAIALKTELDLTEKEYNVLRNWVPNLLSPLSQIQQL
jgi:hypothetical protein